MNGGVSPTYITKKSSVYMNGGVSTTYITKKSSVYMNGGGKHYLHHENHQNCISSVA
jgi:hypothetical protein